MREALTKAERGQEKRPRRTHPCANDPLPWITAL